MQAYRQIRGKNNSTGPSGANGQWPVGDQQPPDLTEGEAATLRGVCGLGIPAALPGERQTGVGGRGQGIVGSDYGTGHGMVYLIARHTSSSKRSHTHIGFP